MWPQQVQGRVREESKLTVNRIRKLPLTRVHSFRFLPSRQTTLVFFLPLFLHMILKHFRIADFKKRGFRLISINSKFSG